MTIKEMFKKIEAYNEVADIMNTSKARLYFEYETHWGEKKDDFKSFRKYVRREFVKELADIILNSDEFEMDKEISKSFTDCFGTERTVKLATYIVS